MFHFGFSYIGLIWLLMLFIPNYFWTKNKPAGYDKEAAGENKVLLIFERIGQALVTVFVLIFKDFNIDTDRLSALPLLALSFLLMICYELYWLRYFKSKKTMKDFYSSFLGIPVAGATCPILAFFLLGLYGSNFFLMLSVIILGIGHIGIHVQHKNAVVGKSKRKLPVRILKKTCAVLGCVFVLALTVYFGIKNVLFIKAFAGAKNPVYEDCYVKLNGQKQFIRVIGKNKENPVIIILHGGPGGPDGSMNYVFMNYLLDDFTYIIWDQRGCGRTYYRNHKADPENKTATPQQILEDIDALVTYASNKFGCNKVNIIGHSWGSYLAVRYSLLHPEKINKTICIGQIVNIMNGDELAYNNAVREAQNKGDDISKITDAFNSYRRNPDFFTLTDLRKITGIYNKPSVPEKAIFHGAISPYLGIDDMRWLFIDNSSTGKVQKNNSILINYMFSIKKPIQTFGTDFKIPVYFISGQMDWICPPSLAKQYSEEITAPDKAFFEIEGCGHTPQADKPKEVAEIIGKLLK
ncbi:MAG: alpha/beta hydrolase [Treponema sp.]|nr:alpha/beta hydrolase [Candidatus Treponema merdequi]